MEFIKVYKGSTKGIQDASFVQFSAYKDQMLVADEVVSSFKAALGTFDLDDKAIANMRTFKDSEGRRRIAFVSLRDPKSYEEFILMRANLNDADTVKKLLGKDKNVKKLLEVAFGEKDNELAKDLIKELRSQGITKGQSQDVYEKIQRLLGLAGTELADDEKKLIEARRAFFKTDKEAFAVETIMRLVSEKAYGPLSEFNQEIFKETIRRGTAATRARNELVNVGGVYRSRQLLEDIGSEKGARYFNKAIVELNTADNIVESRYIDEYMSTVESSLRKIGLYSDKAKMTGTALKDLISAASNPEKRVIYAAAEHGILELLPKLGIESAVEAADSVGSLTNKMAATFSVAELLDKTFSGQKMKNLFGSASAFKAAQKQISINYAIGTIPASDMVDMVKQMIGLSQLESYDIAIKGKGAEDVARITNVYKSILRASGQSPTMQNVKNLKGFKLVEVANAAVEQQFRRVGYTRALQIAAGVSPEDLAGVDPLVLAERLGSKDIVKRIRASLAEGYADAAKLKGVAGRKVAAAKKAIEQDKIDVMGQGDRDLGASLALRRRKQLI